ncbi:MAG: YkvA family protein [Bacillota bacterium]
MRIRRVALELTGTDLAEFLAACPLPERVAGIRLWPEDGRLRVEVDYRLAGLQVPVELALTVADVRPDRLELAAGMKLGVPLPGPVAREVLAYLVRSTGLAFVRAEGDRVVVDVTALGESLQVRFALESVRFTAAGVEVALRDLTLGEALALGDPGPAAADAPEVELVLPLPSPEPSPPPEYGDFYHRLRQKVQSWAEAQVPPRYRGLIPWLLLLPDLFALVVRLMGDPRVPAGAKVRLGIAIAYVISPIDLVPDFLPVVGAGDDLALLILALADLVEEAPPEALREHWSGQGDVIALIRDGARWVRGFFSADLIARLRSRLSR